MSSKFEQLLDLIVNEDQDKANELFHEIVVEKSREIYENLIAEEEAEDEEDEGVEEAFGEEEAEDETVESMFGEEEGEDDSFPVQDQTDDFEDDVADDEFGADEFGGEEGGDMTAPADKGDIKDLEDALEELKAEFEALLGGGAGEADDFGGDEGEGDEAGFGDEEGEADAFGGEEDEDESYAFETSGDEEDEEEDEDVTESREPKSQGERMREYIEKVTATMDGGLVGGRTGETMSGPKEGKSPISSGSGKPTSGATAKNIAQGGTGVGEMSGTSPNADKGSRGLVGATKGEFTKPGTHNVNNVKSGIKTVKPVAKPGNKEFAGVGAKTGGDKAGQTGNGDTRSPLTGAPNRAK